MIEDPRDIERKRTLGIEDPDEITRDDLADALVEVHHRFPAMHYLWTLESEYCGLVTGLLIHIYEIFLHSTLHMMLH